jgi:hypothetical protein
VLDRGGVGRSRPDQRWRPERQPAAVAAHGDEPGGALLHDDAVLLGRPARFEPGMAGAEGGVAGEGELGHGGEDPDAVVGAGVVGGQDEGGLRQVHPVGHPLHVVGTEPAAVGDDGDGVAPVGRVGEDVDEAERPAHERECVRCDDRRRE